MACIIAMSYVQLWDGLKILKYGKNYTGYWIGEMFVKQVLQYPRLYGNGRQRLTKQQ